MRGGHLSVWRKIVLLFTDARSAFSVIGREKGIAAAFWTLVSFTFINYFLHMFFLVVIPNITSLQRVLGAVDVVQTGMSFLWTWVLSFVVAAVFHVIIRFFGGSGIATTYRILAYSLLPYFLFSFIPFIGQFTVALSIFLMIYGVMRLHKFSPFKSAAIILIPLAVFYVALQLWGFYVLSKVVL